MQARDGRLVGAIVLGPRLSEEPYSGEDKRLLASVANQAGLAIDSIRLAERMALQLEAERRAAHESDMARQVQARLLPQRTLPMKTLDYAGRCVQARAVGGDYYDFLNLGEHRIALALADVSGKGMPAALLMASLQAALRTHCTAGLKDPGAIMRQVNRLLYESTAPQHFATLFLAEYDDNSQRLRFVNCGHNPPVLLKSDGSVQRLAATACVLGMFPDWECAVAEIELGTGDHRRAGERVRRGTLDRRPGRVPQSFGCRDSGNGNSPRAGVWWQRPGGRPNADRCASRRALERAVLGGLAKLTLQLPISAAGGALMARRKSNEMQRSSGQMQPRVGTSSSSS